MLETIQAVRTNSLIGDDGRPVMKDSRFETFKKKYLPYKEIYDKNKKYEKFANWYFENKLLGYSPTISLKEVFSEDGSRFGDSLDFNDLNIDAHGRFIGVVSDYFKGISRNGNEYIKFIIRDEVGEYAAMLMDRNARDEYGNWRRNSVLTEFNRKNPSGPAKDSIVVCYGSKGDSILFCNRFETVDEKIYMKMSDLKKLKSV